MSHTTKIKSVPLRDVSAIEQAVNHLRDSLGINVRLERNATPRMYYANQLRSQLGRSNDVCELVLKLPTAHYDVGLIQDQEGTFSPVFDAYSYPSSQSGSGTKHAIRDLLGVPGNDPSCTIGKFLQQYSRFAAINAAVNSGYQVISDYVDQQGNVQIEVAA